MKDNTWDNETVSLFVSWTQTKKKQSKEEKRKGRKEGRMGKAKTGRRKDK